MTVYCSVFELKLVVWDIVVIIEHIAELTHEDTLTKGSKLDVWILLPKNTEQALRIYKFSNYTYWSL